jgi:hypothetical protein
MALSKEQAVADYENSKGGLVHLFPLLNEEFAEFFLRKYNILPPTLEELPQVFPNGDPKAVCPQHGKMWLDKNAKTRCGYRYRCNVRVPTGGRCGLFYNPMDETFLKDQKITASSLLKCLHGLASYWGRQEMEDQLYVDHTTYLRWGTYVKEVMAIINWNGIDQHKIGGQGMIVQIDETQMSKRKNNVGALTASQGQWAFGGIAEDGRFFMCRVGARSKKDLLPIHFRCVAGGSGVHSDLWGAYQGLSLFPAPYNYVHSTVNHTHNFVDPDTGTHTQRVERLWGIMKNLFRTYSEANGVLDREIAYAWYRLDNFGMGHGRKSIRQRMILMLQDIAKVYPAVGVNPLKMPDWVQFADPDQAAEPGTQPYAEWKAEWLAATGGRQPVIGYNVLGIGYELVNQQLAANPAWITPPASQAGEEEQDMEVDD